MIVAFSSSDGTGAAPAALFAVIGWGDYADGIAARVTGQYSRLGTLMDPVTDRLLVISGVVVCWHFALLPRWALAVLVLRELAMLALGRYALTHGVQISINWPGRLGVAPVMGALFFAMAGLETLGAVLLYVGLALALSATVHVRAGRTAPAATPAARLTRAPGRLQNIATRIYPQAQLYGRVLRADVGAGGSAPAIGQLREEGDQRWTPFQTSARWTMPSSRT